MRIITPEIINFYSCVFCQRTFESKMILEVLWFCSNSCKFKYAWRVVDKTFPNVEKKKKFALTKKILECSLR